MNRAAVLSILFAAAMSGACGSSDAVGSSPTGPSSSTPPPASSPPQTTCVAAPTNLRVVSVQGTVVSLAWSGVNNATEYLVLVGSAPSSSNELSTNTTQTNYTWTSKDGKHYARVQAHASCGYSSSSNEVEFTVG